MAAFRFNLESVHSLKRQLEDQAKNRLGLAVVALAREEEELYRIQQLIKMTVDEFRTLSGGVFSVGVVRAYNHFIAVCKERALVQKEVIEEAERVVAEARYALLVAARQREMFDKLREKAYERHIDEEKHREQVSTDELISYRGNRS